MGSDIDIATDAGKKLTLKELQNLSRLIDALPLAQKVDLVDLNRVATIKANYTRRRKSVEVLILKHENFIRA